MHLFYLHRDVRRLSPNPSGLLLDGHSDLNVVSSEEELTAVTGPGASGKTALLVRNSSSLVFHWGRVNVRRC